MSSSTLDAFAGLMDSVDQLIEIHGQVQTGQGRRHRKEAIHRAGVVIIVAAWQAYVEKLGLECLEIIEQKLDEPNNPSWVKASFKFRKPAILKTIGDLNTPNSQNVQRLFDWSFGFDPKPHWAWNSHGRVWAPQFFCDRTDQWLRIRHTIAHGNVLPNNLTWIKGPNGQARLTLNLLRECERHFWKLATLTDDAMRAFLIDQYGIVNPWDE